LTSIQIPNAFLKGTTGHRELGNNDQTCIKTIQSNNKIRALENQQAPAKRPSTDVHIGVTDYKQLQTAVMHLISGATLAATKQNIPWADLLATL